MRLLISLFAIVVVLTIWFVARSIAVDSNHGDAAALVFVFLVLSPLWVPAVVVFARERT